jgi:hypothetical protein
MRLRVLRRVSLALALVAGAGDAALAQQHWSDPATWGGALPGAGAHVVVPQGRRVILDVNPPALGSITVNGVLAFGARDIDLTVGWIAVHGMLEVGTEEVPYPHHAIITLNGPLDENVMGMGARFIGAMNGGRIEIHGSRRADVDWAVLAHHAQPGDTSIALELVEPHKTVLGWRPGDLIVMASSTRDPLQAEAVTVTAVSGTQVSFSPPLRFQHWGELQTVAGRTVDERAEVGLLTRNIVIQGAADGYARQMGGHIMIMSGSIGRIEGAELRYLGQMGRLGRYPMHWHLTGHAPIDYLRFSSIWSSFHRAVVLHRTHGAEVRGNVAANIWSHTFVVGEDGNETGNVVEDNLGILTKRLPDAAFVLKRQGEPGADGPGSQDEWRPATFWVNNANNTVRRNRAAGGLDAIGFFYDNDHGLAAPGDLARADFSGNVAHSYLSSDASGEPLPQTVNGVGLVIRPAERAGERATFGAFTAFQNSVAGAWVEHTSSVLSDAVLAGNASGAVVMRGTVEHAFIVGQTANQATPHPRETRGGGVRTIAHDGANTPRVRHTTFVNQEIAAIDVEGGHLLPGNVFENITRIDTSTPVFLRDRRADHAWSGALFDADGSLTGSAGAAFVTGQAMAGSVFMAGWGSYAPGGAFVAPVSAATAPRGLATVVTGANVTLAWSAPDDAASVVSYLIEAGTAPGRVDVVLATGGPVTTHTVPDAPTGEYFVRVRAQRASGLSDASNEVRVRVRVGAPVCLVPDTPAPLRATVSGAAVTLTWTPARGAARYLLGVGAAPDQYGLLVAELPVALATLATTAPSGTYFVRIAAVNVCGMSVPSNEIAVVVP